MNGVLPTLALVGLAAAGGLAIGQRSTGSRSLSPNLAEHPSPLDNTANHGQSVQRLSLHVQGVPPPDAWEGYFAGRTTQRIVRNAPRFVPETRVTTTPGCAADLLYGECVGFLDYHILPNTGGAVYIDFYTTRGDQRGHGYGTQLIEALYARFPNAPWIDWGRVMDDRAEATFRRLQQTRGVPRSIRERG